MNCFFLDNKRHGEYKDYCTNGELNNHCFYVNDTEVGFDKIPLPNGPEELMLFKLKYDLQLLPVETKC